MKQIYRPMIALAVGTTLCIMAIAEMFGAGNAPQWFLSFGIPILGGLLIERGIRKSRHPEETK